MKTFSLDNVLNDELGSDPRQSVKNQVYPMLLGLEGPLKNQRFALNKRIITIGRDMAADILLKDSQASRRHAHVIYSNINNKDEPQECMLYDAGITAGTFVNGERITEKGVLLQEKDRIQLGRSIFCFILHDESKMTVDRKIEEIATRDSLTGLLKPLPFKKTLIEEVARAKRYKRPLSLILLSVSSMENVVEKYGLPAKQTVLKKLAGFLCDYCRTNDLLARLDGDVIAVALPETEGEDAYGVATRMNPAIGELDIHLGTIPLNIKIHVGVAEWNWGVGTADILLFRAEQALHDALLEGETGVVQYVSEDTVYPEE